MTKKAYPEFHKALLDQNLYPSATRRIKFEQTRHSYLYKTGSAVYKIRRTGAIYSSLAIKEIFNQEALRLSLRWAPDCDQAVLPLCKKDDGYNLSGDGEVIDYVFRMNQLTGHHWLNEMEQAHKINPTALGRLARFLATQHEALAVDEKVAADTGRPEHFRSLVEEIAYQVKKYIGPTVTQPMFDLMTRPVEKFIDESRKLFLRRMKKGHIVDGHGAFLPEHIFMKGKDVLAVSPLDGQQKYRVLDVANDLAVLINEMTILGAEEDADLFLKRYIAASHDREVGRILPVYQTFQAMRSGLSYNEWIVEGSEPPERQAELAARAHDYYNLAVQRAREIPRAG